MRRPAPALPWVSVAIRIAAAVYLLGFMCGDLVFPQYFCEEYFVYASCGGTDVRADSSALPDTATSAVKPPSGAHMDAARLGPANPRSEDFCLHIIHPPVFAPAEDGPTWLPTDGPRTQFPPDTDLTTPYRPPRLL